MTSPISSSGANSPVSFSDIFSTSQTTSTPFGSGDVIDPTIFYNSEFATQLSTAPSLGSFLDAIKTAQLNFKGDLFKIQYSAPELHTKFAKNFITDLATALELYENLVEFFNSTQAAVGNTNPLINQTNSLVSSTNNAIANVQNKTTAMNNQVTAYNNAAQTLDDANTAGFATTTDRDAAIDIYNAAATSYNNQAAIYDAAVDAANVAITAYNNAAAAANVQIQLNNQQIAQENLILGGFGQQIPLQPLIPTLSLIPYANPTSIPLLPYADFTSPVPRATSVTSPTQSATVQITLTNPNFRDDFLKPYFLTPFANLIAYITGQQKNFKQILKDVGIALKLNDITKPDAFVDRNQAVTSNASGAGGLTSLVTGLDNQLLNSLMSKQLTDQVFLQQYVHTSFQIEEQLLPFVLGMANSNTMRGMLPGLATLGNTPISPATTEAAARIAMALGGVASLLGSLNADALSNPIRTLLNSTSSENGVNLTKNQEDAIAQGLTALVSNGVVKLAVGSLAAETKTPELANVFDAAFIQASPQNANAQFSNVQNSFAQLVGIQGQAPIAELLSQFLASQLTQPGPNNLDLNTARRVASSVANNLSQNGLPPNITALNNQLTALLASTLGNATNPSLVQSLTGNISLFTLAASTKSQLQDNLITAAGPRASATLTDQIIKQLFGFSVDFTDATIIQPPAEASKGTSLVSALQNNLRVLNNKTDNAVAQQLADDFSHAHETVTQLEAFLREVIDPGAQLFGIMYEQTRGNIPSPKEKATTDIDV